MGLPPDNIRHAANTRAVPARRSGLMRQLQLPLPCCARCHAGTAHVYYFASISLFCRRERGPHDSHVDGSTSASQSEEAALRSITTCDDGTVIHVLRHIRKLSPTEGTADHGRT